jgi:O-antigen/teichoic acid export membrane protein
VKGLWRSPTLRSAAVVAAGGAGFAGANLILARALPESEYALFTLFLALVNLGFALAPAGIETFVVRQPVEFGPRFLKKVTAVTSVGGLAFGAIGLFGYGLSLPVALMLALAVAAGGIMSVAASQFQGELRFGLSLSLAQSPNLVLIIAALLVLLVHAGDAKLALIVSTLGFVVAAWYGWAILLRERHAKPARTCAIAWGEAVAFAGVNASGLLLVQLDRLIIPHVRPLGDLATFGVLAAIVGSLFRVLQQGVGYSLLPRLRAASGVVEQRRLLAHEARLVGAITVAGSAFIWLVTPLVVRLLLAGKYHLTSALIVAAIVSGVTKILNAFSKASVSALASQRELALVNYLGWVSVVVAVAAGVGAGPWGLTWVIYAVALGWLLRSLPAFYVTMRHLRLPATMPVTSPGTDQIEPPRSLPPSVGSGSR